MKQKKTLQHTSLINQDFSADYLKKQLIAYIGNKRILLKFLGEVFYSLTGDGDAGQVFMDPFAGSGAVSRLGKYLGYSVSSNDWEPYSHIINSCYLTVNQNELSSLFQKQGGLQNALNYLNSSKKTFEGFISKNYAPKNTDLANYKRERLFYTRENALFIDFVRSTIEEWYPGQNLSKIENTEKNILLASLLYESATHANTSGVFKACHKGFGGFGQDALSRIMAPMILEEPFLINGKGEYKTSCKDAKDFLKNQSARICYLDPPYNIHQYGSNYHLLNTIVLWDSPKISNEYKADETLQEKAGIRKDWINRRSDFCRMAYAKTAFENLLNNIDSEYIVLSYNTEGIIPFDEICDIMSSYGDIEIRCKDYIKYKGGRQSLNRKINNIEFVLTLKRSQKYNPQSSEKINHFLNARKILNDLKMIYSPFRLKNYFKVQDSSVQLFEDIYLESDNFFLFKTEPDIKKLVELKSSDLLLIKEKLELCMCKNKMEEAEILIGFLDTAVGSKKINFYMKKILNAVRKFAFKKYKNEFYEILVLLDSELNSDKDKYQPYIEKVTELKRIAKLRFEG